MDERGYSRVHHFVNMDKLPRDLAEHLSKVYKCATSDVSANVFVFFDVDGTVNPPDEEWLNPYAITAPTLIQAPWSAAFDDAVLGALGVARGGFPVKICIFSRLLLPDCPRVLQTDILAHELGHAHQIETCREVYDAWDHYAEFLLANDHPDVLYWWRPLEIHAELFARQICRRFHLEEELQILASRFRDYELVLEYERSGGFNLEAYFKRLVRDGSPGLAQWLKGPGRGEARSNHFLIQPAEPN